MHDSNRRKCFPCKFNRFIINLTLSTGTPDVLNVRLMLGLSTESDSPVIALD